MKAFVVGSSTIAAACVSALFALTVGISSQAAAQELIGQGSFKGGNRQRLKKQRPGRS